MLFGVLFFSYCSSQMTFASATTVPMVVQDYFERNTVPFSKYDVPVALRPSDLSKQQNVYAFMPTHDSVWITEHSTVQNISESVYADWTTERISLWFPLSCDTDIQWTISQTGQNGILPVSFENTWHSLSIPSHPYLSSFDLDLTCHQQTIRHHLAKNTSSPIPKISWLYSDQTSLLIQDAVGYIVHIQQQIDHGWQTMEIKHPVHNLERWLLPPTQTLIQIQVVNGQQVIKESIIQPHFPRTPILNTVWDAKQSTLQVQNGDIPIISAMLHGPDTTLEPTPSSEPNALLFSGVTPGFYWLTLSDSLTQSVQAVWAYDGIWNWFTHSIWQGDHPTEHSVVTYPQFLRWGDQVNIEIHKPDSAHIEQKTINGNPLEPDQTVNLHWSPEDRLLYDFQTHTVLNDTLTTPIYSLIEQRGLLRVDAQISDKRLLDILPQLHQPLSPMSAATILHHGSLFWDALQDRNLNWYTEIQRQIVQSQSYLENMSLNTWQQLDFQTQISIVWASLIAEQQGMTPASHWMHRNLDWLCNLSDTDIPEDRATVAHVRWLLQESMWTHRSCTVGVTASFEEHPVTKDTTSNLLQDLENALREKRTLILHARPQWLHWYLMEKERTLRDRYANLHVSLTSDDRTDKGLFHEWQNHPLHTTLHPEQQSILTVRGVGRIYTSLWYPQTESLTVRNDGRLQVQRLIQQSGSVISPTDLRVGQPIQIVTTISAHPNETICIQSFGASGLTNSVPFQSTCSQTDDKGHWTTVEEHVVQFSGRFLLPATFVATETQLSHTESLWLEASSP